MKEPDIFNEVAKHDNEESYDRYCEACPHRKSDHSDKDQSCYKCGCDCFV